MQQTTPRKLHLDLSSNSFQFRRQVFDRCLQKQNVRQTAFDRLSMDFLGDFFQRTTIRIDTDEESFRILARATVDKEPVAGSYVYDYSSVVLGNEFLKSTAIQLSSGSTAN